MTKLRATALGLVLLAIALPAAGVTYKNQYPVPCNQVWDGVKQVLAVPANYKVKKMDDAKIHAEYDVKHAAHVTITGALLQGTNKVTLVSNGTGCEMQVVSNYSGFEHNDQGDFKKRVDEAMVKPKEAAKPETEAAAKP